MGRYRSGQPGQTVNLLALRLRRFESYSAHSFMPIINPDKIGWGLIKIFLVEFLVLGLLIWIILSIKPSF